MKIKINTIYKKEPDLAKEMGKKDPLKQKKDPVLGLLEVFSQKKMSASLKRSSPFNDTMNEMKHVKMMSGMMNLKKY